MSDAVTLKDIIAEMRRELRRRRVADRIAIKAGALTPAVAARQTARLQAGMEVLLKVYQLEDPNADEDEIDYTRYAGTQTPPDAT